MTTILAGNLPAFFVPDRNVGDQGKLCLSGLRRIASFQKLCDEITRFCLVPFLRLFLCIAFQFDVHRFMTPRTEALQIIVIKTE
jgi:hypothetical protein